MSTVGRAKECFHERSANQEKWLTFDPLDRTDPLRSRECVIRVGGYSR